jgi:integrase/recombinase XerD
MSFMTSSTSTDALKVALEDFLAALIRDHSYARNTVSAYRNDLNQLIDYLKQHSSVDAWSKVTPEMLDGFAAHLRTMNVTKHGGEAKPAAVSTVARKVAALKSFFSYLKTEQLITNDPSLGLEAPRVAKRSPRTLSSEDISRLLAAPGTGNSPKALRDRALLRLVCATGMRVSELVALSLTDLDLTGRTVRAHTDESGHERSVPFDEFTAQALSLFVERGRPAMLKTGGDQTSLFLNPRGQKLTRQGMWLIIKDYAIRAGIKYAVTPHMLRHSFATNMLKNNQTSLADLQRFLGHANISTTQIYKQSSKNLSATDDDSPVSPSD